MTRTIAATTIPTITPVDMLPLVVVETVSVHVLHKSNKLVSFDTVNVKLEE